MTSMLAAAAAPVLRPVPWRRLGWVAWRRNRATVVAAAAVLGVVAVFLLVRGDQMRHAYDVAKACSPQESAACHFAWDSFQNSYGSIGFIGAILVFIPGVLGAFAGAPLLARELETGTYRFAWTQGAGRIRWLLAMLVPGALGVALVCAAYGALVTWYYQPLFDYGDLERLRPTVFMITGLAAMGWSLLAFAGGVLAGFLTRRVVPALAATLAAWTGLAILTATMRRYHYQAPLATSRPRIATGDLQLAQWWTHGGVRVSDGQINEVLRAIGVQTSSNGGNVAVKPGGDPNDPFDYLIQHGYTQWTSYQPNGRYWTFQAIELTWLTVLSILLIIGTVWLVRRRSA